MTLKIPRTAALWTVATLVTAGVAVSFMESYRALYWWATNHQVHGAWAILWPIQIDAFVAVGELALFVALLDKWQPKHRSLPWLITGAGLLVSVAGNVGHLQTHNPFDRLTAAIPPLTAYVMLTAGLGILKRVIAYAPKTTPKKAPSKPKAKPAPRRIEAPAPESESLADPEAVVKAKAFSTLPPQTGPLTDQRIFRPAAAQPEVARVGWDPDSTQSFPRLDHNGHPLVK